jgi:hypothetical protein
MPFGCVDGPLGYVLSFSLRKIWLNWVRRRRLAMYISVYSARLYAPVLHVHYGLLPNEIPQSAISVSVNATPS